MPTNEENIQRIIDLGEEIIQNNKLSKDFYKSRIVLLETEKEKFQEPAKILDQSLFKQVEEVNALRDELSALYTEQVTAGKISDSFWRVVGIGTESVIEEPDITYYRLKKETLKRFYNIEPNVYDNGGVITPSAGFTTESVMIYNGDGSFETVILNKVGDKLSVEGNSTFEQFIEIEDKDGFKLYTEPYTEDLLDTLVARSYGVIESGTQQLTLLTPIDNDTNNPVNKISVGNIITSDPQGAFTGVEFATVQGVGTTLVNLSIYPESIVGVATTALKKVPYITIDATGSAGFGTADVLDLESIADFPLYEFSIDPSEVDAEEYGLDFDDASAYVPQRIRIAKNEDELDGNAVKVERTNTGSDLKDAEWNKFLEGFPNPEDLDVTVEEPNVSNGQQVYILGFTIGGTPKIPVGGSTITVTDNVPSFANLYTNGNGIDSEDQTTIDSKRSEKNTARDKWTSNDGKTKARVDFSNELKNQINEINTEIWGMRLQLGKSNEIISSKQDFRQLVIDTDILNLLNNPDEL